MPCYRDASRMLPRLRYIVRRLGIIFKTTLQLLFRFHLYVFIKDQFSPPAYNNILPPTLCQSIPHVYLWTTDLSLGGRFLVQ